jgi:mannose-6-phosphate isomerase-like protein (cupin superfamily)
MDFRTVLVNKPWGYEYLIYESAEVAVWLLRILHGRSTSLHCHPLKTTGLVILSGEAELGFISDSKKITAPDKQMIRRGLFHSTRATSQDGVVLLEIETPNDKSDLVRLVDDFGREAMGYESQNHFETRPKDALWIEDPPKPGKVEYSNSEARFTVQRANNLSDLYEIPNDEIVMFLKGGLVKVVDERLHLATVPGDVGRAEVLKKVAEQMDFLATETIILRVPSS